MAETPARPHPPLRVPPWGRGLASRVLLLTIAFVMIAEVAIYLPSIASFRDNWLRDRLSAAYTAALVLDAAPADVIPEQLTRDLLASVGAMTIALKMKDTRRLLAVSDMPPRVDERYDLREATIWQGVAGALATLAGQPGRVLGAVGEAPMGGEFIEITLDETPLRQAMWRYSFNILRLSLVISAIVASLAVLALHLLVLRPVRRFTSNLIAFRDQPEDSTRIIVPSGSRDEIGQAEQALAETQEALVRELRQKKHLAALGLAVAKINHDLRNLLSTAQLLSDRLAASPDALGRSVAPKLIGTLDRAIAFCQSTLAYGRAAEPAPQARPFLLRALIADAAETVAPEGSGRPEIVDETPAHVRVTADPDQMFRVFVNLMRNALEALEAAGPQPGLAARVSVRAERVGDQVAIHVCDTGPGVPLHAREKLFAAFQGSNRAGGTGLGLAIARELVEANGGRIDLLDDTGEGGATFRIELPAAGAATTARAAE